MHYEKIRLFKNSVTHQWQYLPQSFCPGSLVASVSDTEYTHFYMHT